MSKGAYNKQNVQNARRTKRMVFQKEANAMYLQIVRRQGPLGHPLGLLPRPSLLWLLLRRQLPALLGGRFGTAGVGHRHGHGHRRPLPVLVGNVLILHHGRQPGSSHDHAGRAMVWNLQLRGAANDHAGRAMIRRRERAETGRVEIGRNSVRLRLVVHRPSIAGQSVTAIICRCGHGRRPASGRGDGVLP